MHKLGTFGLKKFGPGQLLVEKFWAQNTFINFLAELYHLQFFLPIEVSGTRT